MNHNQKAWLLLIITFGIFFGTCTAIIISPSIYTVMSFLVGVPMALITGISYERQNSREVKHE